MTFWTSQMFTEAGTNLVRPFNDEQVQSASYELRMGSEAYVTQRTSKAKALLRVKEELVVPSGQFALLLSEEWISIPPDAVGFISVRSKLKLRGLVNVSGFHVDPGFEGKLLFSVYNAGGNDVRLCRGDRVFLLWMASLESEDERPYNGNRKGQDSIPSSDIMALGETGFAPAALSDRVGKLELQLRLAWGVVVAIAAPVIVAVLIWFAQQILGPREAPPGDRPASSPVVEDGSVGGPTQVDPGERSSGYRLLLLPPLLRG